MSTKIGSVSLERYEQIVTEAKRWIEQKTHAQFAIGDLALEIEPMRPVGGWTPDSGDELFTVTESLHRFAADIGENYATVETERWTASRWPKERRRTHVSFTVHRILASIPDPQERFAAIDDPPIDPFTGKRQWTADGANRRQGRQVAVPVSPQEKIQAIHGLAQDEEVAARVTTDFLRRPEVAFKAMTDDTARHLVNRAQVDRSRQADEIFREESPAAPAMRRIEHAMEFLDLVGACQRFVAGCGRVVPELGDRRLSEDEKATLHKNVDRVKATCDWIETAIDTGDVDMDEELARLLRGE